MQRMIPVMHLSSVQCVNLCDCAQVPRAAIEGALAAVAAVHPAERRPRLSDKRDVHQRHQAVPVRRSVQERRLVCSERLRTVAGDLRHAAVALQTAPQDADRGENVLGFENHHHHHH